MFVSLVLLAPIIQACETKALCAHVCTYIYIYLFIFIYTYTYMFVYLSNCLSVYMYIHTYSHIVCAYKQLHNCERVYTCPDVLMLMHVYVYICTNVQMWELSIHIHISRCTGVRISGTT